MSECPSTTESASGKPLRRLAALWSAEDRAHRYAVVALFAAGFALRFAYLFQPMHYEESLTYIAFVARPLSVGLSWYPYPNNHLLNTLLSHFSTAALGNEPWIIRLPAFLCGILILPAIYLVVRRLYNKQAALLALVLAVPSSQLIDFSTQARGYTIQALLFLVLILFAVSILRTGRLYAWIGFTVTAALGFYAMPTMLYFFPPVLIWMLWAGLARGPRAERSSLIIKSVLSTVGVVALVVLLYLPVVFKSGLSSIIANKYVRALPWKTFLKGLPGNIRDMWSGWSIMVTLVIAFILLIGFVLSVVFNKRISRFGGNLPVVVIAWSVLVLFAQRALPFARNWLPLLPLYLGCAAAGLYYTFTRIREFVRARARERKLLSPGAAAFLLVTFSLFLASLVVIGGTPYQRDDLGKYTFNTLRDAQKLTLFLKDRLKPGDIIYTDADFSSVPLEYYFLKNGVPVEYLDLNIPFQGTNKRSDWNPIGLRPGGTESVKRAYMVISDKENHTLARVLAFAVTKNIGFKVSEFNSPATPVFKTGTTVLIETLRKTSPTR